MKVTEIIVYNSYLALLNKGLYMIILHPELEILNGKVDVFLDIFSLSIVSAFNEYQ